MGKGSGANIGHLLAKIFEEKSTKIGNSDRPKFEARLLASLMLQSNALVSIKTAVSLCSISRQEIDRRVHSGTFPAPIKLSGEEKSIRKAFRINDIEEWLADPSGYQVSNHLSTNAPKNQK